MAILPYQGIQFKTMNGDIITVNWHHVVSFRKRDNFTEIQLSSGICLNIDMAYEDFKENIQSIGKVGL